MASTNIDFDQIEEDRIQEFIGKDLIKGRKKDPDYKKLSKPRAVRKMVSTYKV